MAFLNRWQGVLLAFLMTVVLAGLVVPFVTLGARHIDFWLVWVACMVVLTLPMLLLESALAKRTQALPLQALAALTRDADSSPRWRGMGWLAVLATLLLAGGLVAQVSAYDAEFLIQRQASLTNHPHSLGAMPYVVFGVVILIALALSKFAKWLPLAGSALIILLAGLDLVRGLSLADWQWTGFSFASWSGAVVLALVATGAGVGLYWSVALNFARDSKNEKNSKDVPRLKILPIWFAQIAGSLVYALGLVGFCGATDPLQVLANLIPLDALTLVIYGLAVLSVAALLLAFLRQQLAGRGVAQPVIWGVLLLALVVWILPLKVYLTYVLMVLVLVVAAIYAIFSGWKMKSSHLRKALDFNHEGLYNLWRVMVRLVIPLIAVLTSADLIWQLVQRALPLAH